MPRKGKGKAKDKPRKGQGKAKERPRKGKGKAKDWLLNTSETAVE